jgi:hypothetical protein
MKHRTPTPVALVPYHSGAGATFEPVNHLRVAAALNIQAVRDLSPIWKVDAIVSPFLDLNDVPAGYDTIIVLPKDSGFRGPLGFHIFDGPTAVAVVQEADDWSLFASHELMEMLCDRTGDRKTTGLSLKDGQGRVDYLVEVCDPCQHSTYTIDGVLVSDFVTPGYYQDPPGHNGLYSFTGRITAPRQVLDGGYVTWATQAPNQEIWQAIAPVGESTEPTVATLGDADMGPLLPSRLEREWIDSHPTTTPNGVKRAGPMSRQAGGAQPLSDAQLAFLKASREARSNGQSLSTFVANILNAVKERYELDGDATKAVLAGLRGPGRAAFDPAVALKAILPTATLPVADPSAAPPELAPPDAYRQALDAFSSPDRFGTDMCPPDLAGLFTWLCQLGGF